jgi:hypothetical protein
MKRSRLLKSTGKRFCTDCSRSLKPYEGYFNLKSLRNEGKSLQLCGKCYDKRGIERRGDTIDWRSRGVRK